MTLLAVDGGGSKTDVALLSAGGEVLGAARGPESHPAMVGLDGAMDAIEGVVLRALAEAGVSPGARPVAELGVFCLAGDDLPSDHRALQAAVTARQWVARSVLRNDSFAMLRAGTSRGWGVAVVCGSGINCVGVAPNGRILRFPALGPISGDWGGGEDLGMAALAAAVRARDGRGPRTALEQLVPAHFDLRSPAAVMEELYHEHIDQHRLRELAPVVFQACDDGDAEAAVIVDRLADEVAAMVGAAIRRLRLARTDVDVVLGGGLFRSRNRRLLDRISHSVLAIAPAARIIPLAATPICGAALIGLDELGVDSSAGLDLRAQLSEERLAAGAVASAVATFPA